MKVVLMAIVLFGALALVSEGRMMANSNHMPKQPETFNGGIIPGIGGEGVFRGIYGQPGLGFGVPALGFGVPGLGLGLGSGGYGIGFPPPNYGFVPRHGSRPGGRLP
ncbi:hypothetical protein AMTRI_Chr02g220220 [Amborella trichopoda]